MIEIKNINKKYGELVVLDDINVNIKEGMVTALIGPNGAGKSTLLGVISRLIEADSGAVYVDEEPHHKIKLNAYSKMLGILKQTNQIQVNLTVRELVSFGRWPHSKGFLTKEDEEKIDEAIQFLNLKPIEHKNINHLSGGQRQRAYIAMVVAQDTKYVLLDEPLNNLDMKYSVEMMLILQDLVKKLGKTVVIVLHDINIASMFSDYMILMKDGRIYIEGKPNDIMVKEVLDTVYDHDFCIAGVNGKNIVSIIEEKMKHMKNLVLLILSIGLITVLAGCNIIDGNNDETETITIKQNITHASNRDDSNSKIEMIEEKIPLNPKKIAVFDYGILDIFDSIGLDKLGIEQIAAVKSNLPNYLIKYNVASVINAGTLFEPNVDNLDIFNPDLVIISSRSAWAYDKLKTELGGVAILNVQIDNTNYLESVIHNMNNLKKIFDNSAMFDPLITDLQIKTNNLKTLVQNTSYKALIVMTNGDSVTGYGMGSRFSFIHNELSISPADMNFGNGDANTHGDTISFEYIKTLNPNIIFVVDRSQAIGGEPSIGILDNVLVNSTDAAMNDRIVILDSIAWYIVSGGYQSTLTMINNVSVLYK